jgi:hypothetical protein
VRFGSTRGSYGNQPANPFEELSGPEGPGVGQPRKLFTTPVGKRRRWDNQTIGSTPPRDGPFAQGAQSIFNLTPPRTRAQKRKFKPNV